MKRNKINTLILLLLMSIVTAFAQSNDNVRTKKAEKEIDSVNRLYQNYSGITTDEIMELYSRQPSFGMYKDNYLITGVSTQKPVNSSTADAKFQVSFHQQLFNNILPNNVQLMLIYTQKSFWDIYKDSSPLADNNYNPGLLLTKLIVQEDHLRGVMAFSFEH